MGTMEYILAREWFSYVDQLYRPHDAYGFVCLGNQQIIPFYLRTPDGGEFAISWHLLNLWCNLAWYDIERVFIKVMADRDRVITHADW
ncbi:hypothetical protein SARC_05885 [Sphaeroforma arctica JP610]|uniref:Uncharacterized protein n=1 Tax=Sphaeroforma arctica JP610 TaxID=667725 RepID=A0A0L0G0S9_9EUKA|nr:hypothetical protein SARC_05885 [Sphaeroforma arctica JP610]KNC81813.1 hypothetical protein SARC_05885 [Sphaeroforma arctica JP610]|eukprot:XP_014155715.1 hypothetical protein SARC_05885 [Sphaeroforma arctica JP610]